MLSEDHSRKGGNKEFWRNRRVDNYDAIQTVLSEKKAEEQENVARIIRYFCRANEIIRPIILDVGCGPGTPITLTNYILHNVPECVVIGVDGSEEMISKANANLVPVYGRRFSSSVSDFNSSQFWDGEINRKYDFIISSSALHYLSGERRKPFFCEVNEHLNDKGLLIATISSCSTHPVIADMEQTFRFEYTYNRRKEQGRTENFTEFRHSAEVADKAADINWQSPEIWLSAIREAGFSGADIVWQIWVRTTFMAVK